MHLRLAPLALGLLLASTAMAARAAPTAPSAPPRPSLAMDAQLQAVSASAELRAVARWIADSGDNTRLPFLLIDKRDAQVFVFDRDGKLLGSAPALLGVARGDRLLVGNDVPVGEVLPEQSITPAGRFVSRLALDSHQKELLVLDYAAAISLHPVVTNKPEERRVERLETATPEDNRISHGCINVPADFYAQVVSPAFAHTRGVVYVLPETAPASALFGFSASPSPGSTAGGGSQSGSGHAAR
jgi:hypothetical protein